MTAHYVSGLSDHAVGNVIAGGVVAPLGDTWSSLLDPVTEQPMGRAALSGPDDVEAALTAASDAFAGWRASTPGERGRALLQLADAVEAEAGELAALESAGTGKPLGLTRTEEIDPVVDQLRFFAGAARHLEGRSAGEYLAGHTSMIRREPIGVCAQVTPWNYPLMSAVWKIAPAIAAGNTVVIKPAETTPRSTVRLAELAAPFLPPGVLNVICGDRDTGRALIGHSRPDLVSFTGSSRAGAEVAATAAGGLKRLHLELGGNAAVVVYDDADVEEAAEGIVAAAYFNAGQDCLAASRVLAGPAIHDDLVAALLKRAGAIRVGPPSDPDADYGPLNNADQLARVSGLVDRRPAHAELVTGGHRVGERGYFYAPTIITGLAQDDEIVQQEIFGPVITVQRFDTSEQALTWANDVEQGLACSLWTRDHATAMRAAGQLDFGCVWINTHLRFAAEMPHGGFKSSGYGKELSAYSLEDYTRIKHVMSAW
jgi:betaine-aldehyde dehydrogenase